jgi:hypothetical protein
MRLDERIAAFHKARNATTTDTVHGDYFTDLLAFVLMFEEVSAELKEIKNQQYLLSLNTGWK